MGYSDKEWKKSIQRTGKIILLVIMGFTCFTSLLSRLWFVYFFSCLLEDYVMALDLYSAMHLWRILWQSFQ